MVETVRNRAAVDIAIDAPVFEMVKTLFNNSTPAGPLAVDSTTLLTRALVLTLPERLETTLEFSHRIARSCCLTQRIEHLRSWAQL